MTEATADADDDPADAASDDGATVDAPSRPVLTPTATYEPARGACYDRGFDIYTNSSTDLTFRITLGDLPMASRTKLGKVLYSVSRTILTSVDSSFEVRNGNRTLRTLRARPSPVLDHRPRSITARAPDHRYRRSLATERSSRGSSAHLRTAFARPSLLST